MFLNQEQQIAFQKIKQFLNSKKKIFVLNGAAGTGKTTVISNIFKSPEYDKQKIVLAATTNKAVSVIEQMFNSIHENIDFHTIHKICNIKRSIDHEGLQHYNFDENPSGLKKNSKSIYNYDIIVIDEASMINLSMLKYINSIKNKIKGKIIMVGDKYQLPPVNESTSKAFEFKYYDDSFFLNEIMRFNNNILIFSIRIRNCIDSRNPISIKNINDNTFQIFKENILWIDEYLKDFSYKNTFLAYTNKRCVDINNYIRCKYFKNNNLPEYISNELIVFNNYYNSISNVDNIESNKFYTSNSAKIISCISKNYIIPDFPIDALFNLKKEITRVYKIKKKSSSPLTNEQCPICYENMDNVDNITETDCNHIFCENCIRLWLENNKTCPFCRMEIVGNKFIMNNDLELTNKINNLFELMSNNNIKIWNMNVKTNVIDGRIYVLRKEQIKEFNMLKDNIKNSIINLKNYIYKNLNKHDNRFILKRIWEYYYINYIDIFADISYGYCITVHKSQGSTYENVFIDSKNILEYNRKDYINYKCLYTAITRASKKVLMLV